MMMQKSWTTTITVLDPLVTIHHMKYSWWLQQSMMINLSKPAFKIRGRCNHLLLSILHPLGHQNSKLHTISLQFANKTLYLHKGLRNNLGTYASIVSCKDTNFGHIFWSKFIYCEIDCTRIALRKYILEMQRKKEHVRKQIVHFCTKLVVYQFVLK